MLLFSRVQNKICNYLQQFWPETEERKICMHVSFCLKFGKNHGFLQEQNLIWNPAITWDSSDMSMCLQCRCLHLTCHLRLHFKTAERNSNSWSPMLWPTLVIYIRVKWISLVESWVTNVEAGVWLQMLPCYFVKQGLLGKSCPALRNWVFEHSCHQFGFSFHWVEFRLFT